MSRPSTIDLVQMYGRWLETSTGTSLRPPAALELDNRINPRRPASAPLLDVLPEVQAGTGRIGTGRRLALAFVAVTLLGFVWVSVESRWGDAPLVATTGTERATGLLFVLPDPQDHLLMSDGRIYTDETESLIRQTLLIGRPIGDGFDNVVFVIVGSDDAYNPGPFGESREIQLSTGAVRLLDDDPNDMTVLSRPSGAEWIKVIAKPGQLSRAVEVMEGLSVGVDGLVGFDSRQGDLQTIDRRIYPTTRDDSSTYKEIRIEENSKPIVVETMTHESPALLIGIGAAEAWVEPSPRIDGWELRNRDSSGEWNALAWQMVPGRTVVVSGHVPFDDLYTVAQSLEIVDEETWKSALPGYQSLTGP